MQHWACYQMGEIGYEEDAVDEVVFPCNPTVGIDEKCDRREREEQYPDRKDDSEYRELDAGEMTGAEIRKIACFLG